MTSLIRLLDLVNLMWFDLVTTLYGVRRGLVETSIVRAVMQRRHEAGVDLSAIETELLELGDGALTEELTRLAWARWPLDADLYEGAETERAELLWSFILLSEVSATRRAARDPRQEVADIVESVGWPEELRYLAFYARPSRVPDDPAAIREDLENHLRRVASRYRRPPSD